MMNFKNLKKKKVHPVERKLLRDIWRGIPIRIEDWENYIDPYPEMRYYANEAKKLYKRSPKYKKTLIYGTRKSTLAGHKSR